MAWFLLKNRDKCNFSLHIGNILKEKSLQANETSILPDNTRQT